MRDFSKLGGRDLGEGSKLEMAVSQNPVVLGYEGGYPAVQYPVQ